MIDEFLLIYSSKPIIYLLTDWLLFAYLFIYLSNDLFI